MSDSTIKKEKRKVHEDYYYASCYTTDENTKVKMTHSTSFKGKTDNKLRAKVTMGSTDSYDPEIRIEALEPVILHIKIQGTVNIKRIVMEKDRKVKKVRSVKANEEEDDDVINVDDSDDSDGESDNGNEIDRDNDFVDSNSKRKKRKKNNRDNVNKSDKGKDDAASLSLRDSMTVVQKKGIIDTRIRKHKSKGITHDIDCEGTSNSTLGTVLTKDEDDDSFARVVNQQLHNIKMNHQRRGG